MLYAISENQEKIPAHRGKKGFCPLCGEEVIPKCGNFVIHHWAHKNGTDCDIWYEPESKWHKSWKEKVKEEFREFSIEKNGTRHRADIHFPSGITVELQKTALSFEKRIEREKFYNKMFWIIESSSLGVRQICRDKKTPLKTFLLSKFKRWVVTGPHNNPIFLDLGNGKIIQIKEFGNKASNKELLIYGFYLNKEEFIRKYFNENFTNLEENLIDYSSINKKKIINCPC